MKNMLPNIIKLYIIKHSQENENLDSTFFLNVKGEIK